MPCRLSSGARSCRSSRSARSLGPGLRGPGGSCAPLSPGHALCYPDACQPGPALSGACQDAAWAPTSCQAPCFGPTSSVFRSPCPSSYWGSLGCDNAGLAPWGYGGAHVQSLGRGPGCYRPPCFSPSSYQSACVQPAFRSRWWGPTY